MSSFGSIFRRAFLIHREISAFLTGAPETAKIPGQVVARLLRELPDVPLPELIEAVSRAATEVGREIDMDGLENLHRDGGDVGLSAGSRPSAASLEDHANRMEGLAMDDRESRIRQRAYRLWEQDGWPAGMEAEHWARAERELFADGAGAEPMSEAATQSASAGKRPAVRSKSRAAKSPGATSLRVRTKPPK